MSNSKKIVLGIAVLTAVNVFSVGCFAMRNNNKGEESKHNIEFLEAYDEKDNLKKEYNFFDLKQNENVLLNGKTKLEKQEDRIVEEKKDIFKKSYSKNINNSMLNMKTKREELNNNENIFKLNLKNVIDNKNSFKNLFQNLAFDKKNIINPIQHMKYAKNNIFNLFDYGDYNKLNYYENNEKSDLAEDQKTENLKDEKIEFSDLEICILNYFVGKYFAGKNKEMLNQVKIALAANKELSCLKFSNFNCKYRTIPKSMKNGFLFFINLENREISDNFREEIRDIFRSVIGGYKDKNYFRHEGIIDKAFEYAIGELKCGLDESEKQGLSDFLAKQRKENYVQNLDKIVLDLYKKLKGDNKKKYFEKWKNFIPIHYIVENKGEGATTEQKIIIYLMKNYFYSNREDILTRMIRKADKKYKYCFLVNPKVKFVTNNTDGLNKEEKIRDLKKEFEEGKKFAFDGAINEIKNFGIISDKKKLNDLKKFINRGVTEKKEIDDFKLTKIILGLKEKLKDSEEENNYFENCEKLASPIFEFLLHR